MATTDARLFCVKAQAFRHSFALFKNDGTVITGATGLDSEISKDDGTFADCSNEATEVATASGHYYIDFTTTETTCTSFKYQLKSSSTGAVVYSVTIPTIIDYREISGDPEPTYAYVPLDSATTKVRFKVYDLFGRPATGLTFSAAEIQISKQFAAYANSGGTDAEVDATDDPGVYTYTVTASEADTEGVVTLQIAKTGYYSGGAIIEVGIPITMEGDAVVAHISSVATSFNGVISNLRKNTAWPGFMFDMFDATDMKTPETGASVTCKRSIDGAAPAACTNAPSEVDAVNLPGTYTIDLSAADLNGNNIALYFTAPGCTPFRAKMIMNPT
jgi:hypothetical protein